MTRLPFLFIFFLALTPETWATAIAKHVVVISIDGGKPSTIEKTDLPILHRIAREGSHSWEAQTILPSITLPSHASMVSGVDVDVHGLRWNDYKPQLGLVRSTTMFAEAKAAGLTTAIIAAKEKFKHLNLPGSLDFISTNYRSDRQLAEDAAAYLKQNKPNLILIHFAGPDATGHKYGWDTPRYLDALRESDASVGVIRKALEDSGMAKDALLIITADHGGSGKTHGSARPEHRNIPWIIWGKGVRAGLTLPSRISTMDTAATSLWALGVRVPTAWQGNPVREAIIFNPR